MQVRDRLIQETEGLPEKMLVEMLDFLQVLKGEATTADAVSTQALVARVEYLETVLGIQKGLASFDRGEGIPADEALESLRQKYNIPRR
jgi:predicted transcriptional regulator